MIDKQNQQMNTWPHGTYKIYIIIYISVTETEVVDGILKIKDPEKHCLWLKRNIKDIEKQESNFLLSRYIGKSGMKQISEYFRNTYNNVLSGIWESYLFAFPF